MHVFYQQCWIFVTNHSVVMDLLATEQPGIKPGLCIRKLLKYFVADGIEALE